MNLKKIAKKWGVYALGVMAITGGMVAGNVVVDNSMQVSAASITDYINEFDWVYLENNGQIMLRISSNNGGRTYYVSLFGGSHEDAYVQTFEGCVFYDDLTDIHSDEASNFANTLTSKRDRPGLYCSSSPTKNGVLDESIKEAWLVVKEDGFFKFDTYSSLGGWGGPGNGVVVDYEKLTSDIFTQTDIDNAYAEGKASVDITVDNQEAYNQGYESGLDSVNSAATDSQGKYVYFFKTNDGFGNLSYSTYITSEETKSNILALKQFFTVLKDSDYTYYSNRQYVVNIDKYLTTGTLQYEDLIINGDDRTTTSSESYLWFSDIAFYSPSNNLTAVFNKMSAGEIRDLTTEVINIIKDNELTSLNDASIMDGLTINMDHMQFESFGTVNEDEENFSYSFNGNINLQIHSHESNNTYEVTRRSYDDMLYGTYGNGYSEEQMQDKYDEGFIDGAESVDITSDNESAINQYITDNNMKTEEEYNAYGESQFKAGAESVDITSDNESAINQYITDNNMKTEEEYNTYGESQFKAGADSVDITSNDKAVFDKGYSEGVESVDITSDNQEAIQKYITDNNMKTETEYKTYGETKYSEGYKAHTFGETMKDLWDDTKNIAKKVGNFFITYIGFGFVWDKEQRFR